MAIAFFRSFMFAYMEGLVRTNNLPERNRLGLTVLHFFCSSCCKPMPACITMLSAVCHGDECRVVTCIRQWGKKMVDAGFQPLVFEDSMEVCSVGWEHWFCLLKLRLVARQHSSHDQSGRGSSSCSPDQSHHQGIIKAHVPQRCMQGFGYVCPQVIIDQLNSLGTAEPLVLATLEANMRDGCLSPLIVMLLRMLTSAAIQRRSDFFAPFIMVRRQSLPP